MCKLGVINQLRESQEKGKAPLGAGPVSLPPASMLGAPALPNPHNAAHAMPAAHACPACQPGHASCDRPLLLACPRQPGASVSLHVCRKCAWSG